MRIRSLEYRTVIAVLFAFVLAGRSVPAAGQAILRINDDVNFRFGANVEAWADWTEDANSAGYSQNIFMRRAQFIVLATVAKNVSVFYMTDNPKVGSSGATGTKVSSGGFITQDAFIEWKLGGDHLMFDGGLFLVPSSRDDLALRSCVLAFDIGTWALQSNALEQGNVGRDYGLGLHGYVVDDRLEYRLAAFDGRRNAPADQAAPLGPAAGSRNPYRVAGRLNYDFFDLEHGDTTLSKYAYVGTNLGTKKVLAVGVWGDGQGAYKAYGADFLYDWPIAKDAVTVTGDWEHFEQNVVNPTLPRQNDFFAAAGYYFHAVALQPFLVYQALGFSEEKRKAGNQQRYGGGLNWYVHGNNLKVSLLYERIAPDTKPATARIKDTNHIAVQIQAFYF
jgi:hypothetical protein